MCAFPRDGLTLYKAILLCAVAFLVFYVFVPMVTSFCVLDHVFLCVLLPRALTLMSAFLLAPPFGVVQCADGLEVTLANASKRSELWV